MVAVTGLKHVELHGVIQRVVSSHQAVIVGIATHAEKEHAIREERRNMMVLSAPLLGGNNGTIVQL